MQNAGLQYGQGAVGSLATPPFMHADVAGNGGTTSSLRQFRKKDQMDKHVVETGSTNLENVARVAPHNYYPSRPNDCYRYPQYPDYNIPSQVKYSEISEPQHIMQHADHQTPTMQKAKLDMYNVQPPHMKQSYADHLNGQQRYSTDPMSNPAQYFHKENPHMQTPYKQESQYPQFQQKFNIPTQSRKLPAENDFLSKLSKINPTVARSIMSDYHMREPQHPSYSTLDQNRMYQQQSQRYYPAAMQSNSYYNYNYPASCSYKPPDYSTSTQMSMPRYPTINPHDRSISPRRGYPDNLSMGMNYSSIPQKLPSAYSQCSAPEYAQHYQHRRTVTHQEYYSHYNRSSQFITNHQISPEITESPRTVSNNLKQYIENWADEETTTEMAQSESNRVHSTTRDEATSETPAVYMINAYLENGMSLENGQYIIKNIMDGQGSSGMVRIFEAGKEKTELENNVVNVHIVEAPKSDCMITEKLQTEISVTEVNCLQTESRNSKVVIHSNAIIQPPVICNTKVDSTDQIQQSVIKTLEEVTKVEEFKVDGLPTATKVDKNCSPINMEQLEKTIDLTLDENEKPKVDLGLEKNLASIKDVKNDHEETKIKNELEECSKSKLSSDERLSQSLEKSSINKVDENGHLNTFAENAKENPSETLQSTISLGKDCLENKLNSVITEDKLNSEKDINEADKDKVEDLSLKTSDVKDPVKSVIETSFENEAKDLTTKSIKHMPVIEDSIECDLSTESSNEEIDSENKNMSSSSSQSLSSSSEDEDSDFKEVEETELKNKSVTEEKANPTNEVVVPKSNEEQNTCENTEIKENEVKENIIKLEQEHEEKQLLPSDKTISNNNNENQIVEENEQPKSVDINIDPEKSKSRAFESELDENFAITYKRTKRIFSVDDIIGNTISRERKQRRNSFESLQMFLNKEKEICEEYAKIDSNLHEYETLDLSVKEKVTEMEQTESESDLKEIVSTETFSTENDGDDENSSEDSSSAENEDTENIINKNQIKEIIPEIENIENDDAKNIIDKNPIKEVVPEIRSAENEDFENMVDKNRIKEIHEIENDCLHEDNICESSKESSDATFEENPSQEEMVKENTKNEKLYVKACEEENQLISSNPIPNENNDDNNNEKEIEKLNHEESNLGIKDIDLMDREVEKQSVENVSEAINISHLVETTETHKDENLQTSEEIQEDIVVEEKMDIINEQDENLEYRNVIKIEENSVLLHIAGELVEINVNLVNGKKVITVVPISSDSNENEEEESNNLFENENFEDNPDETENLPIKKSEDSKRCENDDDKERSTLDQNDNIKQIEEFLEETANQIPSNTSKEKETTLIENEPELDLSIKEITEESTKQEVVIASTNDISINQSEVINLENVEDIPSTLTPLQKPSEEIEIQETKSPNLDNVEENIPIIDADISIGETDFLETGTEITVGNEGVEEEIQLDLTPSEKIFFCTKAAKKAYDSSLLGPAEEEKIEEKPNHDIPKEIIKKEVKEKGCKSKLKAPLIDNKIPQNTHFTRSTIRKQMEMFNDNVPKETKRYSVSDEDHEEFVDFRKRLRARKLRKMKSKQLLKNAAQKNCANKSKIDQDKILNDTSGNVKSKDSKIAKSAILIQSDESKVQDKKSKVAEVPPILVSEAKKTLKKFKIPKRDDNKEDLNESKKEEDYDKPPKLTRAVEIAKTVEVSDKNLTKEKSCSNTKSNDIKTQKNIVSKEPLAKINDQVEKINANETVKERVVKHVSFSNKVNYSNEKVQISEHKQQISPILKNKEANHRYALPEKTTSKHRDVFTFANSNHSPSSDQRKRLSLQEYNSRKRKPSSGNEDYQDYQPIKKSKIEPRIETPPTPTDPDDIINWNKLDTNIEFPKLSVKEIKTIPPPLEIFDPRVTRDPRLKRKLSLEESKNKRISDWEEPQSPTSLPTPTLEKPDDSILEISGFLNTNRKSKFLIDINDLTPTPSHSSQSSEDDMLQIYKEQVDSKLSSLSIQIPKPKAKQFIPDIPPESQILMRKFLTNQQLTPNEVQKVKEIIKFKRIVEYLKTKENLSDLNSPYNPSYEIRKQCLDAEETDFKLHLKKVPDRKDIVGKVKKHSLNLSDSSSDSEFDSDFSNNLNNKSAANYSVVQTSTFDSGVPKLIIKRSRSAIHQPIVRLERLDIDAVERKSFY